MHHKISLPMQCLSAAVMPESVNAEDRTAEVTFYTGVTVKRFSWMDGAYNLRFSMDKKAIRLGRLNTGAPLLNNHASYDLANVFGVVEKAWLKDGQGKARVRFSERPEADAVFGEVKAGILRNVSMGAQIFKMNDVSGENDKVKTFEAVDWEPMEISIVPIPADGGAQFLSQAQVFDCEIEERATAAHKENAMDELNTGAAEKTPEPIVNKPAVAATTETLSAADIEKQTQVAVTLGIQAERKRVSDITTLVSSQRLSADFGAQLIAEGKSLDEARLAVLSKLAEPRPDQPEIRQHIAVTRDQRDTHTQNVSLAMLHRYDPGEYKLNDEARQYRGMGLIDMARESLELGGKNTRGMSKDEIAREALAAQTTSDFPNILANVMHKTLRRGYEAAPRTFLAFSRRGTASDFKSMSRVQRGEAPALLKVNENGEFKKGAILEGKEAYSIATYGRIVSISRQVLVNDDLGAFTTVSADYGVQAANLESDTVWGIITANAALADGVALFHATHKNLQASGAAIGVSSVGSARSAMRLQRGLDGVTFINVQPKYLLIPVALETTAEQFISQSLLPATSAAVVPQSLRSLVPISEPRLDATSAISWYLASDPGMGGVDTIEYSYLDGQEGVYTETRVGFDVDGIEFKARLDFGAKALDFRGLYKNVGA
jgi:hypothetical protein